MFPSKLHRLLWLVPIVALLFAGPASAQPMISVNFVAPTGGNNPGISLAPTDVAGVVPLPNWNNVNAPTGGVADITTGANLVRSTGTATTASVSVTGSPNAWSIPAAQLPNSADGRMMSNYVDTNNTSITSITAVGLLAAGFTGTYDVYVYAIGDSQANRVGDYTIGTQSFRMLDNTQFNGTFTQVTAPGGTGPGQSGNFMRFTGLTGDTFTLTAQAAQDINGVRAPINALQIISTAPVPEPGSLLLTGMAALGGLASWRRRRRKATANDDSAPAV